MSKLETAALLQESSRENKKSPQVLLAALPYFRYFHSYSVFVLYHIPGRKCRTMDDDDPFAVVAPSDKKMSSYLKKSKGANSSKCVETSSHGTNSTRSTTNSTLPPEDSNFFSSKINDFPSKKSSSSGFNNSGSSDSANFAFGNGLEFGQGFNTGSSGFGDDGFGVVSQDNKAKNSRQSAASDPFMAPPVPQSMRNFGSANNDFDAFNAPKPPASMRNFGSASNGFDAFDEPKVPQSMRNFGSAGDDFGAFDEPKVPQSMRNFGSASNDLDAFDSSDPFKNLENPNFGDDGFGMDPFATPGQGSESAWQKREKWKSNGVRSRSGDVPKKSSGDRRKVGTPRRFHSSDNIQLMEEADFGTSPSISSRKSASSGDRSSHSHKSSDKSPRQRERKSDHSPVRRTRSGAGPSTRSTTNPGMNNSGHTHRSEATSQSSESQQRRRPPRRGSLGIASSDGFSEPSATPTVEGRKRAPRRGSLGFTSSDGFSEPSATPTVEGRKRAPRRGSLGFTSSDGSLEPASTTKIPPSRNKSASGPAHRPSGGGRRQRRASVTHTSSGNLDFMQMNLPRQDDSDVEDDGGKEDNGRKDPMWDHERSKKQEKIMEMYRGGELSGKSDHKLNDSSLGGLEEHIDMMAINDDQGDASSDRGSRKSLRGLRRNKKPDQEKEEDGYKESMGRKDRTKGSLLDRVTSNSRDMASVSGHDSVQSGGLSYSEKIMKAQQERNKRN